MLFACICRRGLSENLGEERGFAVFLLDWLCFALDTPFRVVFAIGYRKILINAIFTLA